MPGHAAIVTVFRAGEMPALPQGKGVDTCQQSLLRDACRASPGRGDRPVTPPRRLGLWIAWWARRLVVIGERHDHLQYIPEQQGDGGK